MSWLAGVGGESKARSRKVDWDANRRATGPVSAFSKHNGSLERHNGPCLQLGEGGCLFLGTMPGRIVAADVGHWSLCALVLLTPLV